MNKRGNFSVPVALHVRRSVTRFLDFFFPERGPCASVFEGSRSQYSPKVNEKNINKLFKIFLKKYLAYPFHRN